MTFFDLRQEWLELLYRHHVTGKRIDATLLDSINTVMRIRVMDQILQYRSYVWLEVTVII